jgi:hypothetical protein
MVLWDFKEIMLVDSMPHKTVITGDACASKIKRPSRKNYGRKATRSVVSSQVYSCIKVKESKCCHKKCGFDELNHPPPVQRLAGRPGGPGVRVRVGSKIFTSPYHPD